MTGSRQLTTGLRAWLLAALALFTVPAWAQDHPLKGVALVIGEGDYDQVTPLANPVNDARAMVQMLTAMGFVTTPAFDGDRAHLNRSIERFIEDSADADVALIYYSGHGVEVAGEDFLLPVDADVSTPAAAGASLIGVSDLVTRLNKTVPVTIVLLDACRTSPFAEGTSIELPGTSEPAAVAPLLTGARGPAPVLDAAPAPTSLGVVIGFAAAPGQTADDGPADAHSPYAAALLEHFAAGGYSFGDVMTLVSQEVYLTTKARQVPWTNSSLRRVLTFGTVPEPASGDAALIQNGRRQLLLSIATVPEDARHRVEAVATGESVPMDALFGMLRVLGQTPSTDPEALETQLRQGVEQLKSILADRATLQDSDPEIQRLAGLADEAIRQGALDAAIAFNEQAKARVAVLSKVVDQAEADIAARRQEFAAVYEKSARIEELNLNYSAAADDWHAAYAQAASTHKVQAVAYLRLEATALKNVGNYVGDSGALTRAIEVLNVAMALTPRQEEPFAWGETRLLYAGVARAIAGRSADAAALESVPGLYREGLDALSSNPGVASANGEIGLGNALTGLAARQPDAGLEEEAVAAYRAALSVLNPRTDPDDWADASTGLGNALSGMAGRRGNPALYVEALAAYRQALAVLDRQKSPLGWGIVMAALGSGLQGKGDLTSDLSELEASIAAYRSALEELTWRRVPRRWALIETGLAIALDDLGNRRGDSSMQHEAVAAYRSILEVISREQDPVTWAGIEHNLAATLFHLGQSTNDTELLEQAITADRLSLEARGRALAPLQWASTQVNLASALMVLGSTRSDPAMLEEAVSAYRQALDEWTRQSGPRFWAVAEHNLGDALCRLAKLSEDANRAGEGIGAFRLALTERTRAEVPMDWALTQSKMGQCLSVLAELSGDDDILVNAADALRLALEVRTPEAAPSLSASTQTELAATLEKFGRATDSRNAMLEAREATASALAQYRAIGRSENEAYFAAHLDYIDGWLADNP